MGIYPGLVLTEGMRAIDQHACRYACSVFDSPSVDIRHWSLKWLSYRDKEKASEMGKHKYLLALLWSPSTQRSVCVASHLDRAVAVIYIPEHTMGL